MRTRVVLLTVLLASPAWAADAKIAFLCKQLSSAKDSRLRIQSALGLGSTNDIDAIPCLCAGLGDAADIVRSSSAKALSQLADPSSLECLSKHLNDGNKDVREQVKRTYDLIDGQQVKSGISAVYVLLAPTTDKQDKPNPAVIKLADDKLRAALAAKGVQVAPVGQTHDQAVAYMKSQHFKGFDLRPELSSVPKGLQLKIFGLRLKDGNILGEVGVTAKGPPPPDLIRALAPKLVDEAADEWNWSN